MTTGLPNGGNVSVIRTGMRKWAPFTGQRGIADQCGETVASRGRRGTNGGGVSVFLVENELHLAGPDG